MNLACTVGENDSGRVATLNVNNISNRMTVDPTDADIPLLHYSK